MITNIAYCVALVLSLINLYLLLKVTEGQKNTWFMLMYMTISIVNLGYFCLAISRTLGEALLATKLTYLIGTFLLYFVTKCIAQICDVHFPKWLGWGIVAIDAEIMVSVFTAGFSTWHYSKLDFEVIDGTGVLIKEYGPHHSFYQAMLIVNFLVPLVLAIYARVKKAKAVSWKYAMLLAAGELIIILVYFAERLMGAKFELMPYTCVIYEWIMLLILKRIAMYDVSRNVYMLMNTDNSRGYIVINTEGLFIGADEAARAFLPRLNELEIDRELSDTQYKDLYNNWVVKSMEGPLKPIYYQSEGRDLKVVCEPFYDNNKKQIGYMIQVSDDTMNQNYIRQLKEEREKSVQLANAADAANTAKSEFLSLMSHEIRTPINAILGMNEMILKESDNDNITEFAEDINGSGQLLLSLVNDILDFSKIESGKMDLVEGEYSLAAMIHDIKVMAFGRLKDKNLEFELNAAPNMPSVLKGDERKVRQIIINLMTNAIKYTDSGSVRLDIRARINEDTGMATLAIVVADTGRGISKENQEKLFGAFTRVDEVRNHGIEGTGLGLSITKKFVELMGGTIRLNSEYGKGSTFTVVLDQAIVDATPIGELTDERHSVKQTREDLVNYTGRHILAVDDMPLNLKLFNLFLKDTGMEIDIAESGAVAIELCRRNKYDLVFLDFMMPEMDGIECLNKLRSDEENLNKDVPVIVMTADAVAGAHDGYIAAGFTDYISKPFSSAQLKDIINKYIKC